MIHATHIPALKIIAGFLMLTLIAPLPLLADSCDDMLSKQKEEYKKLIEKQFIECGEDKACREKVKKKSKETPYIDAYKKCVQLKKQKSD